MEQKPNAPAGSILRNAPSGNRQSASSLRDLISTVLHPSRGAPSVLESSRGRVAVWLALLALTWFGVVAPLAIPQYAIFSGSPVAPPEPDLPAKTRFRDCADNGCPWLVVVPAGKFQMGSPASEKGRHDDEGPVHEVMISRSFAIMETEVTVDEFRRFVKETGYKSGGCITWTGTEWKLMPDSDWVKPGFAQTPADPVVCISWRDAKAYATWVSKRTGKSYRLPSETEWEYVARAGSQTRFSFGDKEDDLCAHANVGDQTTKNGFKGWSKDWIAANCSDGHVFTAPVRSFKPNAFGLYDVHGNVWEWVEDCWHDSYEAAPTGDAAWIADCAAPARRVVRGGGWVIDPDRARSAVRVGDDPDVRSVNSGFRLARTLTP